MLLENKKVAIIGGGPGGLTLARLLQLKNVEVKVYERDLDKEVRVQGATLDLQQKTGLKAIEAAGLMEAFKATYRPGADKGRVFDKHAKLLYDEHDKVSDGDFDNDYFRPEIDRGPLRNMLLDSLRQDTVVWDSQIVTMSRTGNAWKLDFKNGTTAVADIVVGADGANSKVRPFVTSARYFYSGVVILQGNVENAEKTVPEMHNMLKGGKIYAFDDEKYLHLSAKGDGSLDFYMSCRKDEDWKQNSGIDFSDKLQVADWFKKEFTGWDNVWFELFDNINLPLLLRPQYCIPFDQTWEAQSNITLLGDAAHLMPPSGEGVNLAMLDALELSACLTGEDSTDIQTAIASYEKPMHERGVKEAQDSMEMIEWMHSEGASAKIVQMLNQGE